MTAAPESPRASRADGGVRREDGFSVVLVVATILVLLALGLALVTLVAEDADLAVNHVESNQALYVAHAGIEFAVQRLVRDARWPGLPEPGKSVGAGWFWVARPDASDGSGGAIPAGGVRLIATGAVGHARRVVQVVVAPGVVTRFAGGGGAAGFAGDGGPATSASLRNPAGIAVASNGDLYIADTGNHAIRRVEFLTGEITTVAGTGVAGFSGDGGPATAARLRAPEDVVLSPSGDLYVADTGNHVIRMVSAASGAITRVAGTGAPGMEGNGGPAGDARLAGPRGVAMDASGSLYLADSGNNRVCRVTAGAGILVVVAGTGAAGYSGDGGPARGAKLWGPQDVALAANGDLYVADTRNHAVRLVAAATGVITTVVGTGTAGFAGDGGPAAAALLDAPTSLDVAKSGDLYVADSGNHRIRRVVAGSGAIGTIAGSGAAGDAGDGGPSTGASLDAPRGVAVSPAGPYFVTDPIHHRVRKVEGVLSVVDWLEPSA